MSKRKKPKLTESERINLEIHSKAIRGRIHWQKKRKEALEADQRRIEDAKNAPAPKPILIKKKPEPE